MTQTNILFFLIHKKTKSSIKKKSYAIRNNKVRSFNCQLDHLDFLSSKTLAI